MVTVEPLLIRTRSSKMLLLNSCGWPAKMLWALPSKTAFAWFTKHQNVWLRVNLNRSHTTKQPRRPQHTERKRRRGGGDTNTEKTETCDLPPTKGNFNFPLPQVVDPTNQIQTQRNQDKQTKATQKGSVKLIEIKHKTEARFLNNLFIMNAQS